jgi:hypothetical protein
MLLTHERRLWLAVLRERFFQVQPRELSGAWSCVVLQRFQLSNGDGDDNGSFDTSFTCGEGARWALAQRDLYGSLSCGVSPACPARSPRGWLAGI